MIDEKTLAKDLIYYRAVNKISIAELAKMLDISINTLQKILKNEYVKEVTLIRVTEKFKKINKEGEK